MRSRPSSYGALLVGGLMLATANAARADIGVIVHEPVSALGFFTRVGHAATYLSNICPDGSPIKMRLCRPGESGGVVIRSSALSENEDYDWAIVPFEEYMHGFGSPDLAPLFGTRTLQNVLEQYDFGPVFARALTTTTDGAAPEGHWRAALATRFDRSIYVFSVQTTQAADAAIVAEFNAAPNKSRFNFFYRNCSDQAKGIFDLILPHTTGDRTSGITMQTPKGLAKALVRRALAHPDLLLRVRRYPQIPGTFSRSRAVLFPMENTYRNLAFAPYWYFGGFREVALGAMFYHEVISPFEVFDASRDFISPKAATLAVEQHQLRQRQDTIRIALASSRHVTEWRKLSALDGRVFQRLAEIRQQKKAEVSRVAGTKAQWRVLEREFQSTIRGLGAQLAVRRELQRPFEEFASDGRLSRQLLQSFEADGQFYVDHAGPWIRLQLREGEWRSTGLSRSQILSGDARLAALILAAVIDYHLHQPEARREDIEYVDGLFTLLRLASGAVRPTH
ncbi:MAG TPA: hypothetical protein VFO21_03280 [Vicinamibacterales bacterium]|nr:hypothetical protein [Vicinamibacterales bacterium]